MKEIAAVVLLAITAILLSTSAAYSPEIEKTYANTSEVSFGDILDSDIENSMSLESKN